MQKPRNRRRIAILGISGALALTGGAVAANAAGVFGSGSEANEGPDVAITGSALKQASRAALDEVGQGRVTGSEVGDEESAYEVEVTKDDGSQVDVQLDKSFRVVSTKDDGREGADEVSGSESGDESGAEGADDGADEGPDADPNEPGHQDAGE